MFSHNQINFADTYTKKKNPQTSKSKDMMTNNMIPHHMTQGYTSRVNHHPENASFKPKINAPGYMYGSELSQKPNPLLIKG
jgi:hypothetical protein